MHFKVREEEKFQSPLPGAVSKFSRVGWEAARSSLHLLILSSRDLSGSHEDRSLTTQQVLHFYWFPSNKGPSSLLGAQRSNIVRR
jgi:hypothetical protein